MGTRFIQFFPTHTPVVNWEAGLNKNKSGGGGASGVSGQVPLNNSLLNVSLGNRQGEWAESEKEVAEEKEVQSGETVCLLVAAACCYSGCVHFATFELFIWLLCSAVPMHVV